MIIFGAGVIGQATLHACRVANIPVECFADDRVKGQIHGVNVLHTDLLKEAFPRASFLLTSPSIGDMIARLKELGYSKWRSCGEVLKNFDSWASFRSGEYPPEHVKYLVRTCLHNHEAYLNPDKLIVQSVDLIITEKCTMKCMDCSNLMQYYEHPETYALDEIICGIRDLCSKVDEIYEVRVIGGEPFVNKKIHLIVGLLVVEPKIKHIAIFTNATIAPKPEQWELLQHEKVRFFITDYDEMSRNIGPLVAELDARGIPYVNEKANGWTECGTLGKFNRTVKENESLFAKCCAKNLATLARGKIYRCPFSANAFNLNAVPDYKGDYLTVADTNREELSAFLRGKTYIESCDHCNGRSYGDAVIEPAIQTKKPLPYKTYRIVEARDGS